MALHSVLGASLEASKRPTLFGCAGDGGPSRGGHYTGGSSVHIWRSLGRKGRSTMGVGVKREAKVLRGIIH